MLILKCTIYILDYVMKNNNILFIKTGKWIQNTLICHWDGIGKRNKTSFILNVCILFSLFIANSSSNIENICVMLFQISIYGVYSSTFFHRHVMIKFKLKQIEEPSLYFNRASKTRTNVFHLAWGPGKRIQVLPGHKKSFSSVFNDKGQGFVPRVIKYRELLIILG